MAEENVIGLAMQLDVTDLKTGIKEANKIIASSKDEFKNATAGMDMWSKSSEGLNAKLGQLGKQLSAQEKIAAGYEAEIARVSAQEGDHSEQLKKLQSQLQKAQSAIKTTQSQMSHYSDSLAEVQRAEKDANSKLGKLTKTIADQKKELNNLTKDYKSAVLQYGKNSREAKELAKKIKDLSGEIEDNEEKVEDAESAFESLGKKISDVGNQAAEKATKGLAKIGTAVAGLVAGFLATAEATRELRTNMGKVSTAFEEAGFSAEQAGKTYSEFYGILGDDGKTTEAINHLAKLASSEEDLAKWANIASGVMGTFGDSLPIESLTEAANETAKTGEVAGSLADALNWAGVSQDKFQESLDECNTEQERNALITETLTGLYGEVGKTYQETNKDIIEQNKAQADLSATMAEVGALAEPVMTQFKQMGAEIAKALLPVVEKIIPAIKENLPIILGVLGSLVAVIGAVNAALLINKTITNAIIVAQKLQAAWTGAVTAAQWLLNAAMTANPIGLVVAAIGALVVAFIALWKNSEAFREFWIDLWNSITKYVGIAIDGIKKAWNGITKFFSDTFNTIIDVFKSLPGKMKDVGKNLVEGLWNGIKDMTSWIVDKVKGFGDTVLGGIKKFFGIHSPSTVMAEVGGYMTEGMAEGIESGTDRVVEAGENVGNELINAVDGVSDSMTAEGEKLGSNITKGVEKGLSSSLTSFDDLTKKIERQKEQVLKLQSEYKSAVMTFGQTSTQAFDVAKRIFNLSQELEANESKVNSLNASYENFNETLAKQSQVEINNLVSKNEALQKQINEVYDELNKLPVQNAGATQVYMNRIASLKGQIAENNKEIEKYQSNIDILTKKQKEAAAASAAASAVVEKSKNAYEKLLDTIKEQEDSLEQLKTQYASELMAGRTKEAEDLAIKIKNLNAQLSANKKQAEELSAAYDSLFGSGEITTPEIDSRSAWQKWIDNMEEALGMSEEKLKSWSEGAGKYISKIGSYFESVGGKITETMSVMNDYFAQQAEQRTKEIEDKLSKLEEEKNAELAVVNESTNTQLADLDALYDKQQISAEEYRKQRTKIEKSLAATTKKINEEKAAEEQKLLAEKDRLARKQFEAEKANSIAMTVINGAQAIIKGFAQLGPIAGAVNAAIQAGLTAVQIATIAGQKYVPAMAKGGIVDKATFAMIGEDGKEAVMPLENNTGWIEELAGKLNSIMNKDLAGNFGRMSAVPEYAMASGAVTNNFTQVINAPKQPSRHELYRDTRNLLALKR